MTNNIFKLFITVLLLYSCSSRFNPRINRNKNKNAAQSGELLLANIDFVRSINIDPDKDPFKVGDWNKEDYKFDGSLIKNYFFGASFDSQNVPIYKFFLGSSKNWQIENVNFNGYKYDGSADDNKAQGFSIKPANFYKYEGINPLVSYDSTYNKSDRMKRFIFYRLQGTAVAVPLNNYLIAVDTYSKLVFAYGKITKTGSIFGQHYPTEFQAVELHGEKRNFYEYDPIGVMIYDNVKKELKLNLYEEYKKEMSKNANIFSPSIHDYSRAVASESGPGLSPYYTDDLLNDIKGREYKNRNGLILYTYSFSKDGKTLTYTETDWKGKLSEVKKEYKVYENSILKNNATYTNGADSLQVGLQNDNYTLYKGISTNILGIYEYSDPGPSFLERVAGETYQGSGYTYKFSEDGKTMKCGENGKTYTYVQQDSNDRAVYDDGSLVFKYWGLRLDMHGGKNDGILYWSMGAGSFTGGTQTSGIVNSPAYKQTK